MSRLTPAVFLDKDGTLIEDIPYNVDPARIQLLPGVAAGLARLQAAGFQLIVVSNQSGVARGRFPEEALGDVEGRLRLLLAESGVHLDGFYYCPHHPDGTVPRYAVGCACRKPAPGMLLQAARDHALDLRASWLIGDILDDVEAGRRAGCCTVLLQAGNETDWVLTPGRMPHYLASNVEHAVLAVLSGSGRAQVAAGPPPLPSPGPIVISEPYYQWGMPW